jgi:hypothetical protein
MIDVCVIMCVWKRVDNLTNTINMLNNQTFKDFDFYIWNNNNDNNIIDCLYDYKNKYTIINDIYNSHENVGGLGRFIYAKKLSDRYSKIIFIDDDQIFSDDLIFEMVNKFQEKTIISWWSWKINTLDYFNRYRVSNLKEADYCGTGGMIVDSKVFKEDIVFEIPEKYKFIEDLWLSFIAKNVLNYKLLGYNFNINIVEDGKDQSLKLLNLKREMYIYLKTKYLK